MPKYYAFCRQADELHEQRGSASVPGLLPRFTADGFLGGSSLPSRCDPGPYPGCVVRPPKLRILVTRYTGCARMFCARHAHLACLRTRSSLQDKLMYISVPALSTLCHLSMCHPRRACHILDAPSECHITGHNTHGVFARGCGSVLARARIRAF